MTKILAVVGATGGQGGSVAAALLNHPEYRVRGITRNANSKNALALTTQGAEMVAADLNDEASLVKAFEGAAIIFAVTDFWEPFAKMDADAALEHEYKQGMNVVHAALKTLTLERFIWSTLPNGMKLSGGKRLVPHFESKNRVDNFIEANEDLLKKTTFLSVGFYPSNLKEYPMFSPHKLGSTNKYVWIQNISPDTPQFMSGNHRRNVGLAVAGILAHPELTLPGKTVALATEMLTMGELLALWGKVNNNVETQYIQVSLDEYDALWPKWGREDGLMMEFIEEAAREGWASGDGLVTAQDLGVQGLEGTEEAFRGIEWEL